MTALRNAMLTFPQGGGPLVRVEYLESDGNQWFDVDNVTYGSDTGFMVDLMLTSPYPGSGNGLIFGTSNDKRTAQTDNRSDLKIMTTGDGKQRIDRYDRSSSKFTRQIGARQTFTFNPKGNSTSSPYRYYSSLSGYARQDDTWYSSAYTSPITSIGVFHVVWLRSDARFNEPMRLYGAELREYSTATSYDLKFKLTPYRRGGVGLMLDEVSGIEHYNQGSGAFATGPDVSAQNGGGGIS